ncbi:MAG: hypothetical protein A3F40_02550 [Chlamydiae bacterium RIFCSPHIGHO2_12_FULL_27_8]|nr:MAG: hypothetical protein A3F40_02550 [Chlamydiae bacterium RIFCSPHIGHO2_12_FULL_27_8]OGN64860.1 MAG: hypothetical protein A2888_03580 [Chlamydiae bacterium RIFCSPLOWO2_01_FULL_28_7]
MKVQYIDNENLFLRGILPEARDSTILKIVKHSIIILSVGTILSFAYLCDLTEKVLKSIFFKKNVQPLIILHKEEDKSTNTDLQMAPVDKRAVKVKQTLILNTLTMSIPIIYFGTQLNCLHLVDVGVCSTVKSGLNHVLFANFLATYLVKKGYDFYKEAKKETLKS